jgi:hypothetical protein
MHSKLVFPFAILSFFGLAGAVSAPAEAGLVGPGNSVSAIFWLPASSSPPPACTTSVMCEIEDYKDSMGDITNTPPAPIPAAFLEGSESGSTISVGDTQIVITNQISSPFCSTALPCSDVFTGFEFNFFGSVDITKVTVDPTSAADFLPVTGGLTFDPTDIFVNVAGDNPGVGDKLILDVTTASVTPTIPEPSTWALMLLGFGGLGLVGYRRTAGQRRAARAG